MPFVNLQEVKEQEPFPGYRGRFVHSETMTIAHFSIKAGAAVPEHSHPHEQVANVIKGEFELTVRGEAKRLGPGSAAVIPSNTPHSGKALTDCYVIDVFHPVREDYR